MINILSVTEDIKFGVLYILRGLGTKIVDTVYSTIDTLYDVAHIINSLNLIDLMQEIENSPFTQIFNAFFILSFIVLFLFATWKITFRILDADNNDQPLFELVKEIFKCGVLIFSVVLIFNTTMDIGTKLSSAIYNNFSTKESTIGDKMEGAYLTVNESCFVKKGAESKDKTNVTKIKSYLEPDIDLKDVNTMKDFEKKIRSNKITMKKITKSGAFTELCEYNNQGDGKGTKDYAFDYNFLFGIVVGVIFLISIAFAVLSLGKRQLELAFLMVISPLVFATSIGRKEQRSALYQQLASLVLQAGALMLLIGLTAITFNAVQNSATINNLDYFTKIVTQSILYLGCAMLLMTGCTSLNRFIGDNVSANSGRDMMMSLWGMKSVVSGVKDKAVGAGAMAVGGARAGVGIFQAAKGFGSAHRQKKAESNSKYRDKFGDKMEAQKGQGIYEAAKGASMQESKNPFAKGYGKVLEASGKHKYTSASKKWDSVNKDFTDKYKNKSSSYHKGVSNISKGINTARRRR